MVERRQWMEEAEREIDEVDDRPPPAVRFPAEPGWRLVWMLVREERAGIRALHCEVAIGVQPITFWGLEAPRVAPSVPGAAPHVTLGQPVAMLPLHGDEGQRLHPRANVFRIAPPTDRRSDEELVAECSDFLSEAQRLAQR